MLPSRNVNATATTRPELLLFLVQERLEVFLPAPERGHEADAVSLRDGSGPTLQFDKTPIGKILDAARLRIGFRREKKELHSLFHHPNLRDSPDFFVVKNPRSKGLKFGELRRHVIVLQAMF